MNTGKLQQTEQGTVSDPHEELGKDWTENYCRLIVTLPQEAAAEPDCYAQHGKYPRGLEWARDSLCRWDHNHFY